MPTETFSIVFELDGRKIEGQARGIRGSTDKITDGFGLATKALAAFGVVFSAGALARSILEVGGSFQQLRAQLETVTGSADAARQAFDFIKDFAAKTPFQVENLTRAFTLMTAKGLEPTADTFRKVGDLAAAMGKDITEAERAVTQAMFGETESIKQFGILIRQGIDTATVTFRGHTETITKDSDSIRDAILRISELNFAGAMERQMNTFQGAVSNMKDAWANFLDQLAQAGALDLAADAVRGITRAITSLGKVFADVRVAVPQLLADVMGGLGAMGAGIDRMIGRMIASVTLALNNAPWVIQKLLNPGGATVRAGTKAGLDLFHEADEIEKSTRAIVGVFEEMAQANLAVSAATRETAAAIGDLGDEAGDAAVDMEKLLKALKAQRRDLEEVIDGYNLLRRAMSELPDADLLPVLDGVSEGLQSAADQFGIGLAESLRGELPKALRSDADRASVEFGQAIKSEITYALTSAFATALSDWLTGAKSFSESLRSMLASSLQSVGGIVGFAQGGQIGAMVGAQAGAVLGSLIGGGGPDLASRFVGGVMLFGDHTKRFGEAVEEILDVARELRGHFRDLRETLGGAVFFTGAAGGVTGGGGGQSGGGGTNSDKSLGGGINFGALLIPDLAFAVQEMSGLWHASIEGLVSGVGDSLEEAVGNMLDRFAQNLPDLIERGIVSLEGVPRILADVLSAGVAQTWEELKSALEVGTKIMEAAMGPARFAVWSSMAELVVTAQEGLRAGIAESDIATFIEQGIKDAISGVAGVDLFPAFIDADAALAEFEQELAQLGITGEAAVQPMADMAAAIDIFNRSLEADILQGVVDVMEQIPGMAEEARQLQAELNQMRFQVELDILELRLTELGRLEEFADVINRARKWAEDINNFLTPAVGGARDAGPQEVKVVASVPIDVEPKSGASWYSEVFLPQADALASMFAGAQSPLEQLLAAFNELFGKWNIDQQVLIDAAKQAFADLVEGIKAPLRDFVDSLSLGPFAQQTPAQQAMEALGNFQELLAAAMGGDVDALAQIQEAAQTALQLGSDAFGTVSDQFVAIFSEIQAGLAEVLGADFTLNPTTGDVLVQEAIVQQTNVIGSGFNSSVAEQEETNRKIDATNAQLDRVVSALQSGGRHLAPAW